MGLAVGGVRDAKNRQFWSLAVKIRRFSRSRKWEMDDFAGCSRRGFPLAQIIACFVLRLRRIVNSDHGWTKLTVFRSGSSLLGSANALETRCLARLILWELDT